MTAKKKGAFPLPRGIDLIEMITQKLSLAKNSKKAKPMKGEIEESQLPKGKELPATLMNFLRFDMSFHSLAPLTEDPYLRYTVWNDLDPLGKDPKSPEIIFLTPEEAINTILDEIGQELYGESLAKWAVSNEDGDPVQNLEDSMNTKLEGKLVKLPKAGEEFHFLYMGKANSQGEYPILGMEWMGDIDPKKKRIEGAIEVFIKYPAFDVYLAHQTGLYDGDDSLLAKEYKEHLKNNPELPF